LKISFPQLMKPSEQMGRSGMSDKAYQNATARREELAREINQGQQRLEALRSELRSVDTFLDQWRKFAGVTVSVAANDAQDIASFTLQVSPPRRKNSKKEEVAKAAYEIIASEGRPLFRGELFKKLIERGLIIEGSDPEMVLSTMLWRMRNVVIRLPGGGYWTVNLPSPDGKYIPGEPTDLTAMNEMSPEERQHAVAGDVGDE
jgi:hypothetical protein